MMAFAGLTADARLVFNSNFLIGASYCIGQTWHTIYDKYLQQAIKFLTTRNLQEANILLSNEKFNNNQTLHQ